MRRCRLATCRAEIPKAKDSDFYQRAGFCGLDHMTEHGYSKARKQIERKKKAEEKEDKAALRKLKSEDYSHQFRLTRMMAQRLANRLDEYNGYFCVSCDTEKQTTQYCGGHFKTAGGHSELALDIRNIHRQCNKRCNMHLSGNIEGSKTTKGYKAGIVERYGERYLEWLESYHEPKNYSCDDLKQIRKEYSAECARIQRGESPSKDWRELDINYERVAGVQREAERDQGATIK